MSNFLLQEPDCVFIHIPKTGGISIRHGVWKGKYQGPVFGVIPESWNSYYKFAFVRHPFDRLISAWKMFTDGMKNSPHISVTYHSKVLPLEDFMTIVEDETIIFDSRRKTLEEKIRHHTIPQTHPFNCLHHAEFIGRFEIFRSDFAKIAHRVGISPDIIPHPHLNITFHGPWKNYLSGELLLRCKEYYRADFELLGYKTE
jgi:hypothetical protein